MFKYKKNTERLLFVLNFSFTYVTAIILPTLVSVAAHNSHSSITLSIQNKYEHHNV